MLYNRVMSILIPVILAGGQGTRLWPASLPNIPKQFLAIGGASLMQRALERALAVADKDVLVVTNQGYLDLFEQKLSLSSEDAARIRLIGETAARNTAPAIALALRYVEETYAKDATLLVVTADHLIEPLEAFVQDVRNAKIYAEKKHIVTFGIVPTRAETGYGYIECIKNSKEQVGYEVRAFHEKPDEKRAQHYIAQGNFMWNSGMFCFSVPKMRAELMRQAPLIAEKLFKTSLAWNVKGCGNMQQIIPQNIDYAKLEKQSIDYAVMEGAENVIAIPASFSWNDIGSWDEACELEQPVENAVYLANSENVSVFSDLPVGVCGLSDIVVVAQNGRVLVMKKGSGQLVKNVAEEDATNA